jgi:toxin ParE1/3/4
MPRVTRPPIVESDLLEIWLYIAEDNPTAADKLLDSIDDACQLLAKSPNAGRARPELGPEVRSHAVGRYVIYYRKSREGIELIRVLSGYRDLAGLL